MKKKLLASLVLSIAMLTAIEGSCFANELSELFDKYNAKFSYSDVSNVNLKNSVNIDKDSILYEVDSNGELVYYDSLNQEKELGDNDFNSKEKYMFRNKNDSIRELRQDNLVKKEYFLYSTEDIENKYKQLEFRKENKYNIINNYDGVSILLDKRNSIVRYVKTQEYVLKDSVKPQIDENKAIESAKDMIGIRGSFQEVTLQVLKMGELDSKGILYTDVKKIEDDYLLVYKIIFSNGIVYVNALDGKIIFISDFDGSGRSFYDREKGRYRYERAVNIAALMEMKGYDSWAVGVTSDGNFTKYDMLSTMNSSGVNAFSFSGHGSGYAWRLTSSSQNGDEPFSDIYYDDLTSSKKWRFVYLDTCNSGVTDNWAKMFNIWSTSKGKVLIETKDNLPVDVANSFSYHFRMNQGRMGGRLYSNFLRAKSDCASRGYNANLFNYRGDKEF